MPKVTMNLNEQVKTAENLLPAQPTNYSDFLTTLQGEGVTEPVKVITMLKRRKLVKLVVGRDESGQQIFTIQSAASAGESA